MFSPPNKVFRRQASHPHRVSVASPPPNNSLGGSSGGSSQILVCFISSSLSAFILETSCSSLISLISSLPVWTPLLLPVVDELFCVVDRSPGGLLLLLLLFVAHLGKSQRNVSEIQTSPTSGRFSSRMETCFLWPAEWGEGEERVRNCPNGGY